MGAHTLILSPANPIGPTITFNHFGANTIFTKDYLDFGGNYDRLSEQLGFGMLRFPGGTVTEERLHPGGHLVERLFDTSKASGFSDNGESRIVTAPAFFQYAEARGTPIKFVLPTENYFGTTLDEDGFRTPSEFGLYEILDYADKIIQGTYGAAEIETFIIGNEFWYKQERQLPEEYGRMANDVSIGLDRIFSQYANSGDAPEGWVAPQIGIQVAQGWRPEQNTGLLKELTPEARGTIDVLIQHFYPSFYHQVSNSPGTFDRLDDIRDAEGFGDVKYYISEWNTSGRDDSDTGLLQASTMLEITRMMLSRDVDYATVWGTQYLNLTNRLSALVRDNSDPSGFSSTLTPAGELFRMMSPGLVGTRALDLDTPSILRDKLAIPSEDRSGENSDQLVMHAFQGEDRTIVFLSSRSDTDMTIKVDYKALAPDFTHLWGQKLSVIDDPTTPIDEGDPTSPFAKPYVTSMTQGAMQRGEFLNLEIGPYEIVRLEFTMNGAGVSLRGHDQLVDPAADYDDVLIGGPGDDLIQGFHGNNLLRGGAGNDTIIGGTGNDTLRGGEGDDLLIGGGGVNELYGGAGNDTLVGSDEGGFMQGGAGGVNHFIVSPFGDTIVEGYRPDEGSTLSFFRAYERVEDIRDTLDIDRGDIVLHHETGTTRLVGAADRIAHFEASLADFRDSSPLHDILDGLLAETPDGAPAVDPQTEPAPQGLLSREEFHDLLDVRNGDELAVKLDALDADRIGEFADILNPTIYAYVSAPGVLEELVSRLDDDTMEDFFARMAPDSIGDMMLRHQAGDDIPDAFLTLNDTALAHWLDNIGPASGKAIASKLGDAAWDVLEDRLDGMGKTTQDYDWMPSDDDDWMHVIEAGRSSPPREETGEDLFQEAARTLEETEEERGEQEGTDQAEPPGGGCFIATVAYADPLHPDVVYLRWFRERSLRPHRLGRAFIAAYAAGGPLLATALRPFPRGRRAVRWLLSRLVAYMARRDGKAATAPAPGAPHITHAAGRHAKQEVPAQ